MEIVRFRTKDHPAANGREPETGETAWTLRFPLENGRELHVELGRIGRDAILDMLGREDADYFESPGSD